MHTGLRITAFAAALAATFGTAYGVGTGVDPLVADGAAPAPHDEHGASDGPREPTPRPKEGGGHGATRAPRPAACRSPRAATPSTSPLRASPPVGAPSCASRSGTRAARP